MSLVTPKTKFLLVLFVSLLTVAPQNLAGDRIVFTCAGTRLAPDLVELLNLYRDAFDALGIEFSYLLTPITRSITNAASGTSDGVCARSHGYIEDSGAPNLVRVEAVIATVDMQLWSHTQYASTTSKEVLSKIGHRVGYRRGFSWVKNYMDRQQGIDLVAVNTTAAGLKMLATGRLDLYVGAGLEIAVDLENLSFPQPIYLVGILGSLNMHPHLHERHKHLAAPLAFELNRLIETRGGPIR